MKKTPIKSAAFINNDTTEYADRAALARRESIAALANEGIADFDAGIKEINEGGKCIVRGTNLIRESGRKFDEAESQGSFEFKLFASDVVGWTRELERRAKVRLAQKAYRLLKDGKAENLEDCAPVMHELFIMAGQIKEAKRIGDQQSHEPINPLSALISSAADVRKWLEAMEAKETAMELYYTGCGVDKLHQIEHATRPIAERHALVEKLLQEKGGA